MNPCDVLILIKGEIKTEEVESLSFDNARRKCKVVFRNGNTYEYSAGNVVCLNNPCQHEFKNQKISAKGLERIEGLLPERCFKLFEGYCGK